MIQFNIPLITGKELQNVSKLMEQNRFCGDGEFTKLCNKWIKDNTGTGSALLTSSCTHALEMAAILIDVQPGDEIIMPSFTFVSTANAFVLRGAKIVFVDIRPDTLNIDEKQIEKAVSRKTKAIVPVHYAGVSCEMDTIVHIAKKYGLFVIEDAAQAVMSKYKGVSLGAIGDIGCYSFHETKNYQSGEGGAILLNNPTFVERAEIIREKGTDRSKFYRGQIDKYSWVDIGSSYLSSDINAAFLYAQFEVAEEINNRRKRLWNRYFYGLTVLANSGKIELPSIPEECEHNAHMFYIKVKNITERTRLIAYLKDNQIQSVFHYIPLHSSTAGKKYGYFYGDDVFTTVESERLLRLPLYYELKDDQVEYIIGKIKEFFDV